MLTSPRSRKGSAEGKAAPGATERGVEVTEESVVKRKTFVSSRAQSVREDQQRQVEELAQVSAAAHNSTVEQMRLLYAQQQSTAKQTEEYLQQQYDNQLALNAKNEAISERLEEQQKTLFKQFEMLAGAMEAVGRQGRQIETLQEMISSPRGSARWGWFARSTQGVGGSGGDDEDMEDPGRTFAARTARLAETVTIATGASIPTPPVYRGCTRKEKKAFMDSYLVYERRVRALNAGSISHVFQMPLSACIEHRTLVRICMYELKKREDQISEEEWKLYFLDPRHVTDKNYGALTQAMKALKMDTEIPDAESRVVKLVSDFHVLLDAQDMDEFPITEPKLSVEFLCAAVEPSVLRVSVNTELKKAANKRLRASWWLFWNG